MAIYKIDASSIKNIKLDTKAEIGDDTDFKFYTTIAILSEELDDLSNFSRRAMYLEDYGIKDLISKNLKKASDLVYESFTELRRVQTLSD